jgi:hypothetical protein
VPLFDQAGFTMDHCGMISKFLVLDTVDVLLACIHTTLPSGCADGSAKIMSCGGSDVLTH